ncbi:MAG: MarR family transcriptional regulator [Chloroflexota bacterium]
MNQKPPPTIDAYLVRLGHAHRRLVENCLQAADAGIHRGQAPLLFALHQEDGQSNAELTQWLNVSQPTTSNIVKRMQKSGMVVKKRDDSDERVTRVYLTEQGRLAAKVVQETIQQINQIMNAGLSADEIATCISIFKKIEANIERSLEQLTLDR